VLRTAYAGSRCIYNIKTHHFCVIFHCVPLSEVRKIHRIEFNFLFKINHYSVRSISSMDSLGYRIEVAEIGRLAVQIQSLNFNLVVSNFTVVLSGFEKNKAGFPASKRCISTWILSLSMRSSNIRFNFFFFQISSYCLKNFDHFA